jgi:hypothetical protein
LFADPFPARPRHVTARPARCPAPSRGVGNRAGVGRLGRGAVVEASTILVGKELVDFADGIEVSKMVRRRGLRGGLSRSEGFWLIRAKIEFLTLLFDAPPIRNSEFLNGVKIRSRQTNE